jgi:general secretion pathway protein K
MKRNSRLNGFGDDVGAALVTVLLLVSVMAIGAVVTFEALGFSIKRSSAQRQFDQAEYYALGGEQLAIDAAESLFGSEAQLLEPRPISFEIEGGRIDGVISDASNCFNINSLVQRRETGSYVANAAAATQYRRLLMAAGFADRQAEQLAAKLIDWIDSDTRPLPSGAEDYEYGALDKPYRAANALVADLSELNLVQGYAGDVMTSLGNLICNHDTTAPAVINVNTLTIEHAPLLVALVGGDFMIEDAVELILSRPGKGYDSVADFWLEPVLASRGVEQNIRRQTSVKPQRFVSRIRVTYFDAVSHLTSIIQVDDAGTARLVSHQGGVLP